MTFPADPYRVLGLTSGASANEIRSAYRRLAKQFHPDAAGERALPRFLAIQAAYERLIDPEGRLRPGAAGSGRGAPAWAADPDRARATRDAYRERRQGWGRARGAGAGSATGDGTAERSERARHTGEPADSTRTGRTYTAGSPTGRAGTGAGRRATRKATPGSTSYDEAAEIPRDPSWQGAGWYGPASGTYWTINPREYADPRKHGPIYQQRARRAAEEHATHAATDAHGTDAGWRWAADGGSRGPTDATGTNASTTDAGSERWSAGGWSYQAEPDHAYRPSGHGTVGAAPASAGDTDAAESLPDLETLLGRLAPHSLLAYARHGGARAQIVLALVAWPPLGFGAAWLIGELTGCAAYAASCTQAASWASFGIQPVVLGLLGLVPTAAAIASFASLATLGVIIPAAAILGLMTVADPSQGRGLLAAAAGIAYLAALMSGVRARLVEPSA